MKLLGHWLSEGVCLAAAVGLGLIAMQAPAVTHDYTSALLQVAQEVERDITERFNSARRVYDLGGASADQIMATLRAREPSNAETLAGSITRVAIVRAAYDRLEGTPDLLRPLVVVLDTAEDGTSDKTGILHTTLQTFTPQLSFTMAAIVYGLGGLVLGRLLAGLTLRMLRRNKSFPAR